MSDWKAVARGVAGRGTLPDALIIGAQKCGTSSLFHYLAEHPAINAGSRKEIHYFDLCHSYGAPWYKGQFNRRQDRLAIDATPYYLFHPLAPQRAARLVPDAKLIVLLREPVSRAFSHYQHERAKGRERLSFEDAIAAESQRIGDIDKALAEGRIATSQAHQHFSYFRRGLYADQIERWHAWYSPEHFLFLRAEDLFAAPQQAFEQTCLFLGIAPIRLANTNARNQRSYDAMNPETRAYLSERYDEPNARLARLTGIRWP
jgi:hypothetical protein